MITCNKCKQTKTDNEFNWKSQKDNKRDKWCKECRKEYDKQTRKARYEKNKYRDIAQAHNRRYGGCLTEDQLKACLEYFNNTDAYTGIPFIEGTTRSETIKNAITFDHIVPISQGGKNHISNIVPTTRQNSSRKHVTNPVDWWRAISETQKSIISKWVIETKSEI